MKERRPAAARSADRKRFPILFQIAAEMEQLAAEEANLEQFENADPRTSHIKDARFELLYGQGRASRFCRSARLKIDLPALGLFLAKNCRGRTNWTKAAVIRFVPCL